MDIPLEYITAILNSKLFQFYFKCYGKRIGDNLYDYYPNTVVRMRLNLRDIDEELLGYSRDLIDWGYISKTNPYIENIDKRIYKMYGLSEKQIRMIEEEESH